MNIIQGSSECLFPACAGVIRHKCVAYVSFDTFPRVCGGDPVCRKKEIAASHFSPRVRG